MVTNIYLYKQIFVLRRPLIWFTRIQQGCCIERFHGRFCCQFIKVPRPVIASMIVATCTQRQRVTVHRRFLLLSRIQDKNGYAKVHVESPRSLGETVERSRFRQNRREGRRGGEMSNDAAAMILRDEKIKLLLREVGNGGRGCRDRDPRTVTPKQSAVPSDKPGSMPKKNHARQLKIDEDTSSPVSGTVILGHMAR